MGFIIKDVFGFEYTMFANNSTCNAIVGSQSFHARGLDMDCQFQIWCAQSGNDIHPCKPSA